MSEQGLGQLVQSPLGILDVDPFGIDRIPAPDPFSPSLPVRSADERQSRHVSVPFVLLVGVLVDSRLSPVELGEEIDKFLTSRRESVSVIVLVGDARWIPEDYIGNDSGEVIKLTSISLGYIRYTHEMCSDLFRASL